MLVGHRVRRRGTAHLARAGASVLAALLGLATAACGGCDEEPPANDIEPTLIISSIGGAQLQADGVSKLALRAVAFDAAGEQDNSAMTIVAESGELSSGEGTVGDDGQLVATPDNGAVGFNFLCEPLARQEVRITAENASSSATFTVNCIDPVGQTTLTLAQDPASDPTCMALTADGESSCRHLASVELVSQAGTFPQAGVSLTVEVIEAILTDPSHAPGTPADSDDLLSADNGTPQDRVVVTTDDQGQAGFYVHSIERNEPMRVRLRVFGNSPTGESLSEETIVVIDAFENQSAITLAPEDANLPAGTETGIEIEVLGPNGSPAAGETVTVRVTGDATLAADGAVFQEGEIEVVLAGEGSPTPGLAVVTFGAPSVTEATDFTVTAEYSPSSELPTETASAILTVYPEGSLILNLAIAPSTIQSDENTTATVTANLSELDNGERVAVANRTVRFRVATAARQRVGFGEREDDASPAIEDPDLLLEESVVTDGDGVAVVTVSSRNNRVRGNAEIIAEVFEEGNPAALETSETATLTLEREPFLQSIVFVSAEPAQIAVYGSAYPSTSVITFAVFDDLDQPLANVPVEFELNATSDTGAGVGQPGTTGPNGHVSTVLSAGTIAGPLSVVATATYNGQQLVAESIPIAVTGGLPSFAHSYLVCNEEQLMQLSPVTIDCTVMLVDRFTNRAPAGLPVQFRAEGGNIQPVVTTGDEGSATATFVQGAPQASVTSVLSALHDSWSYGALLPTTATHLVPGSAFDAVQLASCFDGDPRTTCSLFDLCYDSDPARGADANDHNAIYCPLRVNEATDVGCWDRLEAGALTRNADHLSDGLLTSLGITRAEAQALLDTQMTPQVYLNGTDADADLVRALIEAHLANMHRCGPVTACLTGQLGGVPFINGDECPVPSGCMDFDTATECPQDGRRTITAIARGEESFVDLNGNGKLDYLDDPNEGVPGRHDEGEPITEYGAGQPLDFFEVVIDLPEPFLDKDENCFADDHTGSGRLSTFDALRHTDQYLDEDGSGTYGYAQPQGEPRLTNHQWDRDKQIFFSDHVVAVEGGVRMEIGAPCEVVGAQENCPFSNPVVQHECKLMSDGYTRYMPDCLPSNASLPEGVSQSLRYRFTDRNGNCYSPSFSYSTSTSIDSKNIITGRGERLTRGRCGVGSQPLPGREWCKVAPSLGAPSHQMIFTPQCDEVEEDGGAVGALTVSLQTDLDGGETVAGRSFTFRVAGCPVPE